MYCRIKLPSGIGRVAVIHVLIFAVSMVRSCLEVNLCERTNKMKRLKKIIPIIVVAVIFGFIYSFFHISGREIRNVNRLSDECSVTVTVNDNGGRGEIQEYNLEASQIELLKNLLKENSYTRRLSSTITGVLPDKAYTILADWHDNGKTYLYIRILGSEYIEFEQFGGHFQKIKNPNFETELISILEN